MDVFVDAQAGSTIPGYKDVRWAKAKKKPGMAGLEIFKI
jgi:hypothetical protein